jgi:small-conductance mechanosensitive channel
VEELLARTWISNSLQTWLLALAAFLATFTLLPLARRFVLSHQRRLEAMDAPAGVDLALALIARTSPLFLWVVALWAGERVLQLPAQVERVSYSVIVVAFWLQAARWGSTALRFAIERQQQRASAAGAPNMSGSLNVLLFVGRLAILVIATLLALDNLGVNITALVAGLGIGGIAIALAVQTVLGDLFASLSIALDRPFIVGDLLRIDDVEGTVERIGIKSTRLRSVSGEQVIVANADLLKSRVRNLGRMAERRVLFPLAIAYDTPAAASGALAESVRRVVAAQPGTRFEYCILRQLGESALQYEVCYFVAMDPPGRLLQTIDAVNRGLLQELARTGVRFARAPAAVILQPAPEAPASTLAAGDA